MYRNGSARRNGRIVMDGRSDIGRERVVVIRTNVEVSAAVVIRRVLDDDLVEYRRCAGCSIERCSPSDFVATVGEGLRRTNADRLPSDTIVIGNVDVD